MTVIRSTADHRACIAISDETREHIRTHFDNGAPGSKFTSSTPEELLQMVADRFPRAIVDTPVDRDGRKRVSVQFPFEIGTCNVVAIDKLTEQERATIHTMARGSAVVRCATSERLFPTDECQLVLTASNELITIYPGEFAPPLPPSPEVDDPYWDRHVFITR